MKKIVFFVIFILINTIFVSAMAVGEYNGKNYLISHTPTIVGGSAVAGYSLGDDEYASLAVSNRLYFMIVTAIERQSQSGYIQNGDIILIYGDSGFNITARYIGNRIQIQPEENEGLFFAIGYAEYNGSIFVEEVIDILEMEDFLEKKVIILGN